MAHESELSGITKTLSIIGTTPDSLRGKRVAFTGHMSLTREEFVQIVEDAGGEYHDSLKKTTSYLVTNKDWTKNSINGKVSNKFMKAREYGTRILTEAQFIEIVTVPKPSAT